MAEEPVTTAPPGPTKSLEEKRSLPAGVIAALAFGAVVLVGLYLLVGRQSGSGELSEPSPEAVAYARQEADSSFASFACPGHRSRYRLGR